MVRIVAFALITANIVNAVGNWVLIYGKWGAPAMGAVGSGWSTAIARLYMAAVLVIYLFPDGVMGFFHGAVAKLGARDAEARNGGEHAAS